MMLGDLEENGAFGGATPRSSLDEYQQQQQQQTASVSTPVHAHTTSTRRMSRLRAEAMIAAAQRIPVFHHSSSHRHDTKVDSNACDAVPTSSVNRGSSFHSAAERPRVARVRSQGSTPLTPAAGATTTHEFYLQQSGVQFFIEDLLKNLQKQRPENPSVFIANYLNSVTRGTHVSGRTFEFINSTMQGRLAFLSQLQKSCLASA